MAPKSVKKKLKQPSFAAGGESRRGPPGAEELGVDFDEHVAFVIAAMAERADESASARATGTALEARLEDPHRPARRARRAAGDQHPRRRQRDQGRRRQRRRRADPGPARGEYAGHRHRPARLADPGGADRPDPLLRLLAALVGLDGAAARPQPPRDPRRPPRPRRLREAEERLLDGGPGRARRCRARPARGAGRRGCRPLARRRRRGLGRRAGEPVRPPRGDHRRGARHELRGPRLSLPRCRWRR